jgi:hypothetical protein
MNYNNFIKMGDIQAHIFKIKFEGLI